MPNFFIFTVGKPKLAYAKEGVAEYFPRLERYGKVFWKQISEGTREQESKKLLALTEGMFRVVLDETGQPTRSLQLAQKMDLWDGQAIKDVAFIIGGANGHEEVLKLKGDWILSLSTLTLQHEMALVLLLEQLYRAQTIRRKEPYHRE